MKTLREFKEAVRFIYVCSNHKLPLKNLLDFSSLSGNATDPDPIIPVRIIPIDMTPHTLRSELVILCERFDLPLLGARHRSNIEPPATASRVAADAASFSTSKSSYYSSCSQPPSRPAMGANCAPSSKYLNFSTPSHTSNRMSDFSTPPQSSSYANRFSSPSFPPRVPPFDASNAAAFDDGSSSNDFFAEERYSSFRRDVENAIDSSYTPFDPPANNANFLPLDMVRKIEERAFCEGLTRGIQQCAYQVGYQLGLRSSAEKLLNYDDLVEFYGNGNTNTTTNNAGRSSSNCNIWDSVKYPTSLGSGESLLTSTLSSSPSSSSSTWNPTASSPPNSNGFQMWSRSANTELNNGCSGKIPSTHNSLWK